MKPSSFHLASALVALPTVIGTVLQKRAATHFDPSESDGSWFIDTGNGLGEPLNVIISGLSSPEVLNEDGLINYARAIGFSTECFGIHIGNPFAANLGDGNGPSLIGGNHFRVYFQNGPSANSGAVFLAVSEEKSARENHDIAKNGYNIGRDALVQGAVGTKSYGGVTYSTSAQNIAGLMRAGSDGVNHGIAVDGLVTLLTVTIQ